MKVKYFLICFLILMLIGVYAAISTRASKYNCEPAVNSMFSSSINVVSKEGLEDIFEPIDLDEEGGKPWQENILDKDHILDEISLGPWGLREFEDMAEIGVNIDDVGAKYQYKVDWYKEYDDYLIEDLKEDPDGDETVDIDVWKVFLDVWYFIDPDNGFNPDPDEDEYPFICYQDPDDHNIETWNEEEEDGACTIKDIGFLIPTSVEDYLAEIEWQEKDKESTNDYKILEEADELLPWETNWLDDNNNEIDDMEPWDSEEIHNEWDAVGNKVFHEATYPWWDYDEEEWDYEDFEEEWTYDERTGFLSLYQILDDTEVLFEISADFVIIGYELPVLLGITAVFTVGLIYFIRKRCKIV